MSDTLDLIFKKIISRQYTSVAKKWYEEFPTIPFNLKGSDIWIDLIPTTPPSTTTAIVKVHTKFSLTKDITVPNGLVWFFKENETKITGFIDPRHGYKYAVRLFDGNDIEIPIGGSVGWYWDYVSGILIFDNDPTAYGWNSSSFKISTYQYVGSTADKISNSSKKIWQDPVLEIVDLPGNNLISGYRCLISSEPQAESIFIDRKNNIAEWDGFDWIFQQPDSGMIVYVNSIPKLYIYETNIWKQFNLNSDDIIYDSNISVKDAIDELNRLLTIAHSNIYVDNSRDDQYIETGSIINPFKTITSAINYIPENGIINISCGEYLEDVIIPDNITIKGSGQIQTKISGNINIGNTNNSICSCYDMTLIGMINTTSKSRFNNIDIEGNISINNNFIGSTLTITPSIETALSILSGDVNLSNSIINGVVNELTISHQSSGRLKCNNIEVFGTNENSIFDSISGSIEINNSKLVNAGDGLSLRITNDATITPNILTGVFHNNGIHINSARTVIDGVVGGEITTDIINNTNLIFRSSMHIKNESQTIKTESNGELIKCSIHESIERIAHTIQYDGDLKKMLINACIDNI